MNHWIKSPKFLQINTRIILELWAQINLTVSQDLSLLTATLFLFTFSCPLNWILYSKSSPMPLNPKSSSNSGSDGQDRMSWAISPSFGATITMSDLSLQSEILKTFEIKWFFLSFWSFETYLLPAFQMSTVLLKFTFGPGTQARPKSVSGFTSYWYPWGQQRL